MEYGSLRITVCFQDPFWVGILEREWGGALEVCKVTFGAEPGDREVWEILMGRWRELVFSPGVPAERRPQAKNPKRRLRQVRAALEERGVGTKAQQALQLQREAAQVERSRARKERDKAEAERKFRLRLEKKREKRRGH